MVKEPTTTSLSLPRMATCSYYDGQVQSIWLISVMLNLFDVLAGAKLEPGRPRYIKRIFSIQDSSALCTSVITLACSSQASTCCIRIRIHFLRISVDAVLFDRGIGQVRSVFRMLSLCLASSRLANLVMSLIQPHSQKGNQSQSGPKLLVQPRI